MKNKNKQRRPTIPKEDTDMRGSMKDLGKKIKKNYVDGDDGVREQILAKKYGTPFIERFMKFLELISILLFLIGVVFLLTRYPLGFFSLTVGLLSLFIILIIIALFLLIVLLIKQILELGED